MPDSDKGNVDLRVTSSRRPAQASEVRLLPALFGLAVGSGLPVFALDAASIPLLLQFQLLSRLAPILLNIGNAFVVIAGLSAIIIFWERMPLGSVGIYAAKFEDFLLGLVVSIGLRILEAGTTTAYDSILRVASIMNCGSLAAASAEHVRVLHDAPFLLILALFFLTALAEELAARAYPIERVEALSGSKKLAFAASLSLSVVIHVPFWGLTYTTLILPGEVLLILLYMWRRALAPCFFGHFIYNLQSLLI